METGNFSLLDEYWQTFLKETGRPSEELCSGDLNFDSKGFTNDAQVLLLYTGKKTAVFSTFASFSIDGEPVPATGELFMVLDRGGNPRCIIELEEVEIIPFNEIPWEMASLEGEDESLDEWRERQQEIIELEAEIMGFKFAPDIKMVYQRFSVVYKK